MICKSEKVLNWERSIDQLIVFLKLPGTGCFLMISAEIGDEESRRYP